MPRNADFRQAIYQALEHSELKKPITANTLTSYTSLLGALCTRMKGDETVDWYTDDKQAIVDEVLNRPDANKNSQKTILSALYRLTGEEVYHAPMLELCGEVAAGYKTQKMTARART